MPSLILAPVGVDRCTISQWSSGFLGITPTPAERKGEHGGVSYGPAVRPRSHSLDRYSDTISGWLSAEGRWHVLWHFIPVIKTPTAVDKRRQARQICTRYRKEVEASYAETDMPTVMEDRLAYAAWDRVVKRQCLESPEAAKQRQVKKRKHSPSSINLDCEAVMTHIEALPPGNIVWQAVAAEHGLTGPNRGQILKEFLVENNIDVDSIKSPVPRTRRARRRTWTGVSHPIHHMAKQVRADVSQAVEDKVENEGVECTGNIIISYRVRDGKLERQEEAIHGRKVMLNDLRQTLLSKHEEAGLMRPRPASLEEYAALGHDILLKMLEEMGEQAHAHEEDVDLCHGLVVLQHTRHLILANDHADILGRSYLMEVVQVLYDKALFYTDAEFEALHPRVISVNVQALVETPVIRLLTLSSGSDAGQLKVMPDRVEDMHCAASPIMAKDGSTITDEVISFKGDQQAWWIELGVQRGGHYRCGSACGIHQSEVPMYSQNVNRRIPTLGELQQRALRGKFGQVAGKSLQRLQGGELRQELAARQISTENLRTQDACRQRLREELHQPVRMCANANSISEDACSNPLPQSRN